MLVQTVWQHPKLPMALRSYTTQDDELLHTDKARRELEKLIEKESDGKSHTWGYFPELLPDQGQYPECIALAEAFEASILGADTSLRNEPLNLAFIRRATAEPESIYGGLHVDVSAGIDHVRSPRNPESAILRTLFNLGEFPRTLEYYPYTVAELGEQGITISQENYEILQLPDSLDSEKVAIPPKTHDTLYGIVFISSEIPHAGRTTPDGHFLISYGAYIPHTKIAKLF